MGLLLFILGDQSHSAQQRRSNTMLSVKRLLSFGSTLTPSLPAATDGFIGLILTQIFHASNRKPIGDEPYPHDVWRGDKRGILFSLSDGCTLQNSSRADRLHPVSLPP
jgi:hypothetical protein